MEHYIGQVLPDKIDYDGWVALMANNVRQMIRFDMETKGEGYEAAKSRVKKNSVAGAAVWEILDKEFNQ